MINHWTPFEGSPYGSRRKAPRVTLSPNKILLMNKAAYDALGNPSAVRFFFDETLNRIGVKATSPDQRFAFPIKERRPYSYRFVHAGAFCSHFGIRPERTVTFNDINVDDEGVMTLELAKATKISRGAR